MDMNKVGMVVISGLTAVALVTACSNTSEPLVSYEPAFCQYAFPIYVSHSDEFTERTAEAVYQHNERGRRLCGWRPVDRDEQ